MWKMILKQINLLVKGDRERYMDISCVHVLGFHHQKM